MTWTYSGNPDENQLYAVRFLIHDTDSTDQLLQDEEITYLISIKPDTFDAATQAARTIAARFSRIADNKKVGDLSITYTTRSKSFYDLAASLQEQASRFGLVPSPYQGGVSKSDKKIDEDNPDFVDTQFSIGMHDRGEQAPSDERWTLP